MTEFDDEMKNMLINDPSIQEIMKRAAEESNDDKTYTLEEAKQFLEMYHKKDIFKKTKMN